MLFGDFLSIHPAFSLSHVFLPAVVYASPTGSLTWGDKVWRSLCPSTQLRLLPKQDTQGQARVKVRHFYLSFTSRHLGEIMSEPETQLISRLKYDHLATRERACSMYSLYRIDNFHRVVQSRDLWGDVRSLLRQSRCPTAWRLSATGEDDDFPCEMCHALDIFCFVLVLSRSMCFPLIFSVFLSGFFSGVEVSKAPVTWRIGWSEFGSETYSLIWHL